MLKVCLPELHEGGTLLSEGRDDDLCVLCILIFIVPSEAQVLRLSREEARMIAARSVRSRICNVFQNCHRPGVLKRLVCVSLCFERLSELHLYEDGSDKARGGV